MRSTRRRSASGSALPNSPPTTAPWLCCRHTPAADLLPPLPSAPRAKCRWPFQRLPPSPAGGQPYQNAALSARENGPLGTIVNDIARLLSARTPCDRRRDEPSV